MEVSDAEAVHEGKNEESRDDVTIFINEKLQEMAPRVIECCIYRVPKRLLNMNPSAYEPEVISIGPFHIDKDGFKATEELKLRFLNSYICRIDMSVEGIVEKARSWNKEARQCYSEPIEMNDDEFVKMMLLDGCFVVEFIMVHGEHDFPETEEMADFSFYESIYWDIITDLTMLENQLPFFVLEAIYDVVSNNTIPFKQVVHGFINQRVLPLEYIIDNLDMPQGDEYEKPRHLVDLISYYFVPSPSIGERENSYCLPPTATELDEAGVILKKTEISEVRNLVDISFKDGVLKIPPFIIMDQFEAHVRNVVAFEQFSVKKNKYTIHYVQFLDELICSEKDVNLLVKEGIIVNSIGGSDKEISKLFNDICKYVNFDTFNHLSNISEDLRKHCHARRNKWMASLKRNYFNSPWALISFSAATFLIILTLLQTIFSAMSVL